VIYAATAGIYLAEIADVRGGPIQFVPGIDSRTEIDLIFVVQLEDPAQIMDETIIANSLEFFLAFFLVALKLTYEKVTFLMPFIVPS
jgi:hypothetical protein